MKTKYVIAGLLLAGLMSSAFAQSGAPVKQSGNVTPGQVPWWVTSGVIGGGVSSADSPVTSFGVTNNGGNGICVNSARVTAAGRNALCFGASTTGPAVISLQNYGTAAPQLLNFNVNGTIIPFPGGLLPGITVGSTIVNSGTNGYFLYNNNNVLGNFNLFGTANTWNSAQIINGNPVALPAGPSGTLLQVGNNNESNTIILSDSFGASPTSIPIFNLRRARGTAAVPSAVQFLDNLGVLGAIGYGTTGYSLAGSQIRFVAGENFTDAAQGSFTALFGTSAGTAATAFIERLRVGANGLGTPGPTNISYGRLDILTPSAFINSTNSPYPYLVVNQNSVALPTTVAGTAAQIGGANGTPTILLLDSFGSGSFPVFNTRFARNIAASPAAVQSGDFLGVIGAIGYGATGYSLGNAQIKFLAAQNFTDSAQGTRISLSTTPNGSTGSAIAEALRVDQDKSTTAFGLLKVGPTPATLSTDGVALFSGNASTCPLHDPATAADERWIVSMCNIDGSPGGFGIDTFSQFGVMDFRRANGTASAPTALLSGDFLGVLGGLGYMTTGYSKGAIQLRYYASQNWSDTANGTYMSLITTPNNSTAFAGYRENLRLDQDRSTNVWGRLVVNNGVAAHPAVATTLPAPPTNTVAQFGNVSGSNTILLVDTWGAFPVINTRFARGTQSAPTAAQSGDFLGIFAGIGYGATGYSAGNPQIRFIATENWSDSAQGSRISILTTPNGSPAASFAEVARFDQDKSVTLFGTVSISGISAALATGTAIPAGGTAGTGYLLSSTANFGVFFGSGAPTLSAAKGSLYLRSDGSTTNDRAYINTNGSTTWTSLTTGS